MIYMDGINLKKTQNKNKNEITWSKKYQEVE